jgi:hypothetical protein
MFFKIGALFPIWWTPFRDDPEWGAREDMGLV